MSVSKRSAIAGYIHAQVKVIIFSYGIIFCISPLVIIAVAYAAAARQAAVRVVVVIVVNACLATACFGAGNGCPYAARTF